MAICGALDNGNMLGRGRSVFEEGVDGPFLRIIYKNGKAQKRGL